MNGGVGQFLKVTRHRGSHTEAFGVRLAAITADHFGTGHFGDVGGAHFRRWHVIAGVDRLGDRRLIAGLIDFTQLVHTPQDPVAALFAAHRVGQRVKP